MSRMSYDISLIDPVTKQTLELDAPHHMRGGTYAVGGTTQASLNITYNYAPQFFRAFEPYWHDIGPLPDGGAITQGIRILYGMTGASSLPLLDRAIAALGDDVDPDYWKPTDGNAKRALLQLRALAEMRPDGVWDGD